MSAAPCATARDAADVDRPGVDVAACFATHADWLRGAVYRFTGSRQTAEEVVQETFRYVLEHRTELYDGPGMRGWLLRVARHQAMHTFRARARYGRALERLGLEPRSPVPDPSDCLLRREEVERVRRCLARISAERAAALALAELDGLSTAAVAERLGVAPGTVGSRLTRGRAEFREAWGQTLAEERRRPGISCR